MVENQDLYMLAYGTNLLVKYNCVENNATTLEVLDGNPNCFDKQLYQSVLKIKNKILLAPRIADNIAIYDCITREVCYIDIPKIDFNDCNFSPDIAKFWKGFTFNEYFYLLGFGYPGILRINSKSYEIEYNEKMCSDLKEHISTKYNGFFSNGSIVEDNIALIPMSCCPEILELNLISLDYKIIKINVPFKGIYSISKDYDTNFIWLTNIENGKDIYAWDRKNNNYIKICLNDVSNVMFYPPIILKDKIILVPCEYGKKIHMINKETLTIEKVVNCEELSQRKDINNTGYIFMEPRLLNNSLLLVSGRDFLWNYLDFNLNIIDRKYVYNECPKSFIEYIDKEIKNKGFIINERLFDINTLLHLM